MSAIRDGVMPPLPLARIMNKFPNKSCVNLCVKSGVNLRTR